MILVDSSVWIDWFRNAATAEVDRLDVLVGRKQLAIGDLILTEVLQGTDSAREFERVRRILFEFPLVGIAGRDIAVEAAQNFRRLRAVGVTVRKTIDTLIATRCMRDGHQLLFRDRDFVAFVDHLGLESAMGD